MSEVTLKDGTKLDSGVVKVMQTISQIESGGDYNARGDNGSSAGAYQWNNGKQPLKSGQLPSNFVTAAQKYKLDPNDFSKANQNKVAYAQISDYKSQGLSPIEIDALWNGAHKDPNTGKYVHNNPERLTKFQAALQESLGTPTGPDSGNTDPIPQIPLTPNQQADQTSADQYNPTFAAKTGEGAGAAALKTIGNLPKSIWNFAKGAVDFLNPVSTVKKIGEIVDQSKALSQEVGGKNAFNAVVKGLPLAAAQTILPEAVRDVSSAAYAGVTGSKKFGTVDENLQAAQRAVTNDPFGQVAPVVLGVDGLAKGVDSFTKAAAERKMADYTKNIEENTKNGVPIPRDVGTNFGGAVDNVISKTGQLVTKPASTVFGKTGDALSNTGSYMTSQLTGLDRSTIKTFKENPTVDPTKINRVDVGKEVQSALTKRATELSETGKEYQPIRESKAPVKISKSFLRDSIKSETGLEVKNGKLQPTTTSAIRDSGDVRAIQKTYEFWNKALQKGTITPAEFLNLREDLGKMAKFEKDIGKRKDVDIAAGRIRAKLNEVARGQISGLAELDTKYSPLRSELKELSKGLVDKDGNLTDAGLVKIARVTEEKPALAAKLEKILPGIMKKVEVLRAVEDLKAASDKFKVGTYSKSFGQAGAIYGLATANPTIIGASIAEMILTNPKNAVKLIQKYGKIKPVIDSAMNKLKLTAGAVNRSPEKLINSGAFSPRQADVVQ